MKLRGKQVVVTGGSSGIGLALALAMAERGAEVVVTGRNEAKLADVARTHPVLTPVACDITVDADVIALREVMAKRGGTEVLVNNAGVMHLFDVKTEPALTPQLQEIDIDVAGPVRVVTHFLPQLMERPSVLVNVSSGLAYVPYAAAPVYSASKAFLHSYTLGLRRQLAGTSVRVVELLPPVVDTPMVSELDSSFPRIAPEALAKAFITGFERNHEEIAPGLSKQLRFMQRVAPRYIFGQINKNVGT